MSSPASPADAAADRNWRRFVLFRVLFNSRFYYPVLAVLFLDLGLSPTEYTLLNFAWALAIVFTDVPAGVMADRLGRKPLVVTATIFMVGEMVLLALAPRNGGAMLFLCCLANRVMSGMAEGMASGADEALVFDSLAERNRSSEWPQVLDQVMRWQSVGMVIAMLVGGAIYDPHFMNDALAAVGLPAKLDQGVTLRFPIYLNLAAAVIALFVVVGLREPKVREAHVAPVEDGQSDTCRGAVELVFSAWRWIRRTPVALFIIVGGVLLDSVTRLFMTFSSSYFRIIELPEASYGLIGAGLGGLGLVVSPIARRMVTGNSLMRNYVIMAVVTLGALTGIALRWRVWGVLFMLPLGMTMYTLGFMISYYLNALVESHRRATVLSFKGLAVNLAYGFVSLLFALALRAFRDDGHPEAAMLGGFRLLPLWLLLTLALLAVGFWRHRKTLCRKY
jgi:MFS family permease